MNIFLNTFYTKIKNSLLEIKEYKINFYTILISDIIWGAVTFYLLIILNSLGNIVNWSFWSYILFILFVKLNGKFIYSFSGRRFNIGLLKGHLNLYLTKPINPYFYFLTLRCAGPNLILIPIFFILIILIFIFKLFNPLGFLIFIFGTFFTLVFFSLFEILSFFIKENTQIKNSIMKVNYSFERYLPPFLENTSFFYIIGIFPAVINCFLAIEVSNGNFQYIWFLAYAIPTCLIFFLLCIYIWKKGIQRYEAFG